MSDNTEWMADAACLGSGISFAPEGPQGVATAKAVCAECPVRTKCYLHALDHDEVGIWGGTSERERRAIRTGRRAAPRWAS